MAGLVKLHRGDRPRTERQVWAGIDSAPWGSVCAQPQRCMTGSSPQFGRDGRENAVDLVLT
ncbi:hypothetical protein [Salipiger abyssi]|uniref:hypothetical protein n=1 Tax=Salipiger abyssi TaxID=1250539 RepID=UPI0012EB92C7|nr:hypothetical protein [Salipiger abyssi]